MTILMLRANDSLDSIWEDLVFTEARLSGDERTKDLAAAISELIARLDQVRGGQLGVWRQEVAAQAAVAAVDDQLDDWVRALDTALLAVVAQDTQSPRYRRYFSISPSAIIRLRLERELTRVRAWADSLSTEPEPALQQLGAQLRTLVVLGDQALEQRRKATTSRADHRVRTITSLISDMNGVRMSIYSALTKKAADLRLPQDWANRFFRRSTKATKVQPVQPAQPAPVGQ